MKLEGGFQERWQTVFKDFQQWMHPGTLSTLVWNFTAEFYLSKRLSQRQILILWLNKFLGWRGEEVDHSVEKSYDRT